MAIAAERLTFSLFSAMMLFSLPPSAAFDILSPADLLAIRFSISFSPSIFRLMLSRRRLHAIDTFIAAFIAAVFA